ncbi:UNVERIFIED_CONTAM: S-adenosyl-L-methionine-dependent tRNA 4-demethylwyosine synthase [Siphonaria sp. JEL0065]|nr:S-adenosyl-L-methionine-dependent tRNA 4-demethylwyosine synthase [Siphonaria sp. JEL0065]
MNPVLRQWLPYVTLAVGVSALTFQATVLYPWHHLLEDEFKQMEATQLKRQEEQYQQKMDRLSRIEERLESVLDKLEKKPKMKVSILFSTQEGTTETFADKLAAAISKQIDSKNVTVEVANMKTFDNDDLLKRTSQDIVFFVLSTYIDGGPSDDAAWFWSWLEDMRFDFRVSKASMANLRYSVFGVGDSAYGSTFCLFPKQVDSFIHEMAGVRITESVFGDVGKRTEFDGVLNAWVDSCVAFVSSAVSGSETLPGVANLTIDAASASNEGDEYEELDGEYVSSDEENDIQINTNEIMDLEDLGAFASAGLKAAKENNQDDNEGGVQIRKSKGTPTAHTREMLTPNLRKNLEKQGYKLIGSHSGVKLCRWTKAQMRGRGGCYKHTFYGIESHRCMETTPSLACANKCVFCWRHQTNPVGVEWRWKADSPLEIVEGAIEKHRLMIKQMRGVPGVTTEKFEEGMNVAHCALSLVGEPIMYPYINEFVDLLHERNISSFLVTNAQFPDLIRKLKPITQLYLSIDAGNKETLKKIDRPLFSDFWERFNGCLDELAKKEQRTVFRLTLVKGFNADDLKNYAELIRRGKPDFIEVKGVTFCGYTGSNPLTMSNVPFHEEVVEFVKLLCAFVDDEYEISCEHAHTNSLLISHKKYKIEGVWNTWIDYPKFHALVKSGEHFTAMDYLAPTPDWAVYGDERKGFDPIMTRVYKNKAKYEGDAVAYKERVKQEIMGAAAAAAAISAASAEVEK